MAIDFKKLFSGKTNDIISSTSATESTPQPSISETRSVAPVASFSARIKRIQTETPPIEQLGHSATTQDPANFRLAAKTFEPVAQQFIGLVDRIQRRKIFRAAEKAGLNGRASELENRVALTSECKNAASPALARILARRVKSEESIDWAILSGLGIEILAGYNEVMKELKQIECERHKTNTGSIAQKG